MHPAQRVQVLTLLSLAAAVNPELVVNYTILDDTPAGEYVGNVMSDVNVTASYDVAVTSRLRVTFLSQSAESALFQLAADSGELVTSATVDREQWCRRQPVCRLAVSVAVGPAAYFRVILVNVFVTDRNDHAPVFPAPRVLVSVPESTGPGFLFPVSPASDEDSPPFAVKRYALLTHTDTFSLQTTALGNDDVQLTMMLSVDLDRERVDFYQLRVAAYDGGEPALSGEVTVDVVVQDVNDNSPVFERDVYEAVVVENDIPAGALLSVSARDPDLGPNGYVMYGLSAATTRRHGRLFRVDNATGAVFLLTAVDFERRAEYRLAVTARDHGDDARPTTATVIVRVVDVNDNDPVVTVNSIGDRAGVSVAERAPVGTPLAYVTATDADSGDNGRVVCSLDGDTFSLVQLYESDYKVVLARVVDREARLRHTLTVRCHDNGAPARTAVVSADVIVGDVNDNAPRFAPASYVAVLTDTTPGAYVTRVSAIDADAGDNAAITYHINNDYFAVDVVAGSVTLTNAFRAEGLDFHEFSVTASDNGTTRLAASATVTVMVVKETQANRSYMFSISENAAPVTVVGRAYQTALPADTSFRFSIDDADSGSVGRFEIDQFTGVISTLRALDREATDVHRLRVTARNTLDRSWSAALPVRVEVADQNDNSPLILSPSPPDDTVHVARDTPTGTAIASVTASDADAGLNGQLTFFLSKNDDDVDDEFIIHHNSGDVILNVDLRQSVKDDVTLTIVVRDQGVPQRHDVTRLHVIFNVTSAAGDDAAAAGVSVFTVIAVVVGSVVTISLLLAAILVLRRRKRCSGVSLQGARRDTGDKGDVRATAAAGQLAPPPAAGAAFGPDGMESPPPPYVDNKVRRVSWSVDGTRQYYCVPTQCPTMFSE